jgi:predicted AAA+ superfamily ATPase
MSMIPRHIYPTARQLARGFPILAITGPRQSGKTTLARVLYPDRPYITLEDPEQRLFAQEDPKGFLARFLAGAILDEVQHVPDLFSYLQGLVDQRQVMGDFILTGSQQFGLISQITQSLAGRVGLIQLLPFSIAELRTADRLPATLDACLCQGGYPPLYDRALNPTQWLPNYISTYLERDVRQQLAIRNLNQFQRFLKLCAARTGQLLNQSSLAVECGISHTTVREWLNVLEASYIITLLPPYHQNFGKRLVKTPKLYFLDVGLAAWLLGIRDPASMNIHAQRGALFETLMVAEWIKHRYNQAQPAELYFWRDHVGHEVDLVYEIKGELQAVAFKSGATFNPGWCRSLEKWCRLSQTRLTPQIWYGGADSYTRQGVELYTWHDALH